MERVVGREEDAEKQTGGMANCRIADDRFFGSGGGESGGEGGESAIDAMQVHI